MLLAENSDNLPLAEEDIGFLDEDAEKVRKEIVIKHPVEVSNDFPKLHGNNVVQNQTRKKT